MPKPKVQLAVHGLLGSDQGSRACDRHVDAADRQLLGVLHGGVIVDPARRRHQIDDHLVGALLVALASSFGVLSEKLIHKGNGDAEVSLE